MARFRFIACESAALEGLEIDLREPARVIPPDAMETFLNQLESTDGIETLEAGAMKLVSGRREYALVIDESAYIRDYAMTAPGEDGGFSLRPVIGSVRTGLMLGLVADVKGEGIELSHLEPKIAGHLGTRLCRAEAIVPGGVCHLLWEEPVLLVARADDGLPARITIEDGHSLLIPLRLQVKQGTANARGYARGGRVQERYVQKPGTGEDESALARDHFVLLSVNSG